MKTLTAILLGLYILTFNLNAKIVEESLYVQTKDHAVFELLKNRPELTLDHIHTDGFEVYGPRGTSQFLKQNNIPFFNMKLNQRALAAGYPTPEQIEQDLKTMTNQFPQISKMFSIGKSVQNRHLWVIKISKNVNVDDERPEFKYIANMHGDEIVGREIMVRLIRDLLQQYGKDPVITNLIDRVQIYILPSMNPDGALRASRGNGKNIDLNRDFPDFTTNDNKDTLTGRQPETQAVMKWQSTRNFKLSANFHGGAEVVNYPWDTKPEAFPQFNKVKELALEYAGLTPYINSSTVFNNGITNGFDWYEVNGGMQDWSIYYKKDLQLTVELSDTKWPQYSMNDYYYKENKAALLRFIERVLE
jgi:hypothetical protein